MTKAFYQDPADLFRDVHIFWPTAEHSPEMRLNASVRFVIYSTLLSFSLARDKRILLLGMFMILVMSMMHVNNGIKSKSTCQKSTDDNPFGNFLSGSDRPDRPSFCPADAENADKIIRSKFVKDDSDFFGKKNPANRWYTMPSTTAANDRKPPAMLSSVCRDGSQYCDIDSDFFNGIEGVHSRAHHASNGQLF